METFNLYHNNPNNKTLKEVCKFAGVYLDPDDSKKEDKYTLKDLFEDNKQSIFNQMSLLQRIDYIKEKGLDKKVADLTADDLDIEMTLPCPLKIIIPKRFVTYQMGAKNTTFQVPVSDVTAFEDAQIRSSIREDAVRLKFNLASVKKQEVRCSVIGFFKTLYYNMINSSAARFGKSDGIYQTASSFTDISDFICSLSTSVGEQGGTFSFSLPHVPLYHLQDFVAGSMGQSDMNKKDAFANQADVDALTKEIHTFSGEDYSVVKSSIDSTDYFNWLISPNDLMFISFDKIDKARINDADMAMNTFDMIGLVESVTLNRDSSGNITVNVSGKDLMKLIQDDSSIFFPNASVIDRGNFFDNVEGALRTGDLAGVGTVNGTAADKANGNGSMLRMPSTGSIRLFNEECNGFTIDYIIKVAIRELANIQICPSEIFQSWGERRTKFQYFVPKNEKEEKKEGS